jgi:NAD-specific glutamate dehydrogenase
MALCIFDVFRAQMGEDFLDFLSENNIKVVYVPACCTDRLQPLDVSVQKAVKNHLRQSFEDWYADEIVKQLNENKGSESEDEVIQPVDLSLTRLKPLSAKWLVKMVQHIKNNSEIVRRGFRETGISNTLAESLEDKVPLSKVSRE